MKGTFRHEHTLMLAAWPARGVSECAAPAAAVRGLSKDEDAVYRARRVVRAGGPQAGARLAARGRSLATSAGRGTCTPPRTAHAPWPRAQRQVRVRAELAAGRTAAFASSTTYHAAPLAQAEVRARLPAAAAVRVQGVQKWSSATGRAPPRAAVRARVGDRPVRPAPALLARHSRLSAARLGLMKLTAAVRLPHSLERGWPTCEEELAPAVDATRMEALGGLTQRLSAAAGGASGASLLRRGATARPAAAAAAPLSVECATLSSQERRQRRHFQIRKKARGRAGASGEEGREGAPHSHSL